MEYKRLGDYIREVNVRNKDLKVTNLQGVSISKQFIPSIANTIGTDMSTYKVVCPGQFAYGPVTSRNGDKVSIALYKGDRDAIISQAYTVFEVVDSEKMSSEYLMMWFQRPEFDRYARFHSHGSAREIFDWDELCGVYLPLPDIDRQREIVEEYETLSRRIRLNEQMIEKLEATAQALYRKMFVDGIDKENLPEGWSMGTLSDIAIITMGQSPDGETYNIDGDGMIFYQGRTDFGRRFPKARVYTTSPTREAEIGDVLLSVRAPVGDLNIAPHKCCLGRGLAGLRSKMNFQSYLYYQMVFLSDVFKVSDDEGTIFGSINKDDLYNIEVIVPNKQAIELFNTDASIIDNQVRILDSEITNLQELQSLLLAKMGNLKQ